MISDSVKKTLLAYQRDEITEYHIYRHLASLQAEGENKAILTRIAEDEKRHAGHWRRYTGQDIAPDWMKVRRYVCICRLFGFTFGTKLMERGEETAQQNYGNLPAEITEADTIRREENEHEQALLALLDEERLRYIGSVVLGLNDALVELTGALAGLTLALQNTRLIAVTGCITGIAAAFSMAASEYLSTKAEKTGQHPLKAAVYTGTAYVVTVVALILPYLLLQNYFIALACTLAVAVSIIALFNYYLSVAKSQPFARHFFEMAGISLGVASLSFVIGLVLRLVVGVEV